MQLSPDRLYDFIGIFKCPVMRRTQKIMADFTLGFLEKRSLVTVRYYLKMKVLSLSVDPQMPADIGVQKMKVLLC